MSDILYLGLKARQIEDAPAYQPISCVKLTIGGKDANGNPIVCTAGNPNSGRTIETSNPLIWDASIGDNIAKNILTTVQGYVYKPYTADGAIINPVAEIGDAVEVGDVYSVIADVETTFSPLMSANISAPVGSDIDHEYPYESSESYAQRRTAAELGQLKTEFIVQNGEVSWAISQIGAVDQEGSIWNKLTSVQTTVDGITIRTEENVTDIIGNTQINWANINVTPEQIKTEVAEYFDASGAAGDAYSNATRDANQYTDTKISPIEKQYTSAIEQSAKQIKATVAAAETIWDTSELSQTVQNNIEAYGYGMPDKSTASQYSGKYYLDQSSGTLYKSNGSKWVKQDTQLKTIQVTTNSKISVQAGQISSIVEETIPGIQTQVSEIKQTAESISLSVSPTILKNEYGQPINEYGWVVSDPSQYVYTGGTDFTITGEGIEATTETVYLNVDAAHITGTIYANAIQAGTSISSPNISGGSISSTTISVSTIDGSTIIGGRFQDTTGYAALQIWSSSMGAGTMYYGPSNSSSRWNAYLEVTGQGDGTYPYTRMVIGGAGGILANGGVMYPQGVWDFSQATVRGLPSS